MKQNKWYYELMTIRQTASESVDEYSLRFQKLLRKVNTNQMVPAVLQVRMYLYGLNPLLTPLVSTANPADLAAAIERARIVETGYNYVPTKEMTVQVLTTIKESQKEVPRATDLEALTQQMQQLTLGYANLTSALAAQTYNPSHRASRNQIYNQNSNRSGSRRHKE